MKAYIRIPIAAIMTIAVFLVLPAFFSLFSISQVKFLAAFPFAFFAFIFYVFPVMIGITVFKVLPDGKVRLPDLSEQEIDTKVVAKVWGVSPSKIAPSGLPFQSDKLFVQQFPSSAQRARDLERARKPRGISEAKPQTKPNGKVAAQSVPAQPALKPEPAPVTVTPPTSVVQSDYEKALGGLKHITDQPVVATEDLGGIY